MEPSTPPRRCPRESRAMPCTAPLTPTTSQVYAWRAVDSKAVRRPKRPAQSNNCEMCTCPSHHSQAMSHDTRAMPQTVSRMSIRRSSRSVIAPATNPTSKLGAERTAKITPTMLLESVMANTTQLSRTCCIPIPIWLQIVAPHNMGKPGAEKAGANLQAREPAILRRDAPDWLVGAIWRDVTQRRHRFRGRPDITCHVCYDRPQIILPQVT